MDYDMCPDPLDAMRQAAIEYAQAAYDALCQVFGLDPLAADRNITALGPYAQAMSALIIAAAADDIDPPAAVGVALSDRCGPTAQHATSGPTAQRSRRGRAAALNDPERRRRATSDTSRSVVVVDRECGLPASDLE